MFFTKPSYLCLTNYEKVQTSKSEPKQFSILCIFKIHPTGTNAQWRPSTYFSFSFLFYRLIIYQLRHQNHCCLAVSGGCMHSPFLWRRNPTKTLGFLLPWISPWMFDGFLLSSPPYTKSYLRKPSFCRRFID
jgi:hypothetical protein